jgi:hypothetical protein
MTGADLALLISGFVVLLVVAYVLVLALMDTDEHVDARRRHAHPANEKPWGPW